MRKADKMTGRTVLKRFAITTVTCAALALPVAAQNLFATVVNVNDQVITEFEISQRSRFLQMIGAPDSSRDGAIEALIV
jgi:peptidyl-prolyl cis-trans isomerase SurA